MTLSSFKSDILPHYRTMWNIAYAVLGDSDDASDAVQEGMLKLWTHRDSLANVRNIGGYCAGVARNIAITMLQNRRDTVALDNETDRIASSCHDNGERVEWRHEVDAVMQALAEMPPKHREVMRLSSMAGLDNAEIAAITRLSNDNVRAILSRARRKLRQLFPNTL